MCKKPPLTALKPPEEAFSSSRTKLPLLLIMMLLLQHHILHLHQADLRASLIFIQLHRDIFDIFARLRNNYVFQRIDSPARFLDLGCHELAGFLCLGQPAT